MFGLSPRVYMFTVYMYTGLFLALIIPATLSDNVFIQTEVGSKDNISLPNVTCHVNSGMKLCESFGAQEVVHGGKNCSCFCPQHTNTFGFDGNVCKCLPNDISYEGCPEFSQIDGNVLQRDSSAKLLLPLQNCSLAVLYRKNNGSWITVKNVSGILTFSQSGIQNGSFVYVLTVSSSIEGFKGTYNVIVQCPQRNSTCLLLKLPSNMTCPLMLPISTTSAPTNSTTTNVTNSTKSSTTKSSGLSDWEVVAIIVSGLIFLAIILLLLFLWIRRRRQVTKNNRRESQQQMTGDLDDKRRDLEPVVFSRPNRTITQRKDSANLGFEDDIGNISDENYEDPDYALPLDEKHSVISDFFNKIQKKPLSVNKSTPKHNENREKSDNESDEYQIMDNLKNPDNLESTAVYENTINGLAKNEPKPEPKQPTYKKIWRTKLKSKKDKKSEEHEIPKKQGELGNMEQEHVYENNEAIRNNLQHKGPSRTPIHENRASFSNNVSAEEEEGPPPPPRSTSLERVLDESKSIAPSPRMGNKLLDIQIDNEFENDPSELYENTRKGSYPKPSPRVKR